MTDKDAGSGETMVRSLDAMAVRSSSARPATGVLEHSSVDAELAAFGGKGANLARLVGAGLPVPPGFCIDISAYRRHLDRTGLDMPAVLGELEDASSERTKAALSRVRAALRETELEQSLLDEVRRHHDSLGADWIAVRSSATAEDLPEHSFAGQHGTYFVAGLEQCAKAVRDCWASLWTDRAYAYREQAGCDQATVAMAVVVQDLIMAEVSGVAFTADPVTGVLDRVVIEACFGLGEALVSGKVEPDRFVVSKAGRRILERHVAHKAIEIKPESDGTGREVAVAPERAKLPTLDDAAAQRVAAMAVRAEEVFRGPQDVEWALSDGQVFMLQARAITTAGAGARTWDDRQVWSNANTGEVLPDVVTPLNWSLLRMLGPALLDALFGRLGFDFGSHPIFGLIAGRVYFNINTFVGALRAFPGMRTMDIGRIFGGQQSVTVEGKAFKLPDEDVPDFELSRLRLVLAMPGLVLWAARQSPKRGEAFVQRMNLRGGELLAVDRTGFDDSHLLRDLDSTIDELFSVVPSLSFTGMGMFYFHWLDRLGRRWLGDDEGSLANRLVSGLGGMESAEAGFSLWKLAVLAHEHPEVEQVIAAGQPYPETRAALKELADGRLFLERWDTFMREHGHHARGELELSNPRWSETPDYVLDMVRAYLGAIGTVDPIAHHEEQARARDRLVVDLRRRMRNPAKRFIVSYCLGQAQRGAIVRENTKSAAVRYFVAVRRILLEVGARLAARGTLAAPDDIWFLNLEEVGPALSGAVDSSLTPTVRERRAEHERNRLITPPKVVVGRFEAARRVERAEAAVARDEGAGAREDTGAQDDAGAQPGATVLRGLAVSPGVVTGRARVILRADVGEQVLPGEVLVAPFTDPGWTPYFLPAAAIVMDLGGLLSHGSIVAREYGIPAVVNVGPATELIKTGQMIRVDGTAGTVTVLE